MRIPPNVDVARAETALKETLEADPPLGAKVDFDLKKSGAGWDAPALAPWLALSADQASEKVFGKPCCYVGRGGSIPFSEYTRNFHHTLRSIDISERLCVTPVGMLGKMFRECKLPASHHQPRTKHEKAAATVVPGIPLT